MVHAPLNDQLNKQLAEWQRLSPLSVAFFVTKLLTRLLKEALPSLAPLAVIIFNSDNKLWLSTIIVIAAATLILVHAFLQYWFFKFKQQGQKVLVNDGVFKKNHRVIQFDRIQNINILQPIYFKPFDLVTLQIETAGAKGNEADLVGIGKSLAEYLRAQVLQQQEFSVAKNQAADNQDNHIQKTSAIKSQTLAQASLKDLVKYGVSSNGIFWFFVFLAPIFGLSDDFLKRFFNQDDFVKAVDFFGGGLVGDTFLLFFILAATIFFMFAFSILGAVLRYFNYQLLISKQPNNITLKRSSGLLTNYQESLKLQKIQTLIFQSNFIGRWLKVVNLTLGQVSTTQNKAKNRKSLFVIPARKIDQSLQIQAMLFSDSATEFNVKGIDRRYINKTIAIKIFFPSLLIAWLIYSGSHQWFVFVLPFLLSLIMLPLVIKRWKAYQFGMKNGYGKFERGLFGFRHIIFPLYKVQRAEVRQSPIQRRRNLATLKIYLASNHIQMQYIPIEEAQRWLTIIGQEIEATNLAWY